MAEAIVNTDIVLKKVIEKRLYLGYKSFTDLDDSIKAGVFIHNGKNYFELYPMDYLDRYVSDLAEEQVEKNDSAVTLARLDLEKLDAMINSADSISNILSGDLDGNSESLFNILEQISSKREDLLNSFNSDKQLINEYYPKLNTLVGNLYGFMDILFGNISSSISLVSKGLVSIGENLLDTAELGLESLGLSLSNFSDDSSGVEEKFQEIREKFNKLK